MRNNLTKNYEAQITAGQLNDDTAQRLVLAELSRLQAYLHNTSTKRRGFLASLFKRNAGDAPRGLYLYGGVGAGKSMLMDLFFNTTDIQRKRRVHFHAFMQEIHEALNQQRKAGASDPLTHVAANVAANARLLCFDEMQISDIADAMLVGGLFQSLLALGVCLVVTSNRPPDDLYLDGLNRQIFLPFIDLIKDRMTIHHLHTDMDYRQDRLRGQQCWFAPSDAKALAAIDRIWNSLTDGHEEPLVMSVKSRAVTLPRFHNGVARAGFDDLCANALGAADYLALTSAVRLLVLENIPVMSRARNNEAKRFVTLIDTLYEAKIRLIASAAADPEQLYKAGPGAFEFQRTASRLREMQSAAWGDAD